MTLTSSEKTPYKPRILIFLLALAPYRLHIYNELSKYFEVKIISLDTNLLNQKFDQEKLRHELIVSHDYLLTGFTLLKRRFRFGIKRKIEEYAPDVVISPEYSPATLAIAMMKSFARKRFTHIIQTDDNPQSIRHESIVRRGLRSIVNPHIEGVVVISEEAAKTYRSMFSKRCSIGVVPIIQPETIFRDRLTASKLLAQNFRQRYELLDKQIILYVGRLARVKSIDRLIAAFSIVARKYPDALVVLVGEGPELNSLRTIAAQMGVSDKVRFVGRSEGVELAAWYRIGDLFVLPSNFEPFGAVVNEALISGIPVICSDKAGARVLVRDGVNGTIIDASDVAALSDEISAWLLKLAIQPADIADGLRKSLMPIMFIDAVQAFATTIRSSLIGSDGDSHHA